ncbi:transcription termination factor Rho [candidate division KSB1 bacterium]|nr:transcription termination factor Rho [candidate division KSB1 bacterium]
MSDKTCGVLQLLPKGGGFLRDPEKSYQPDSADPWVSAQLIRRNRLEEGAVICGPVQKGDRGYQLTGVESVCGLSIVTFQARTLFNRLLPIDPGERFRLGDCGETSMRIIELIAPFGKGTRGLIVAPPKSGKTRLLEDIANAIRKIEPETRIVVLLVDERPEEVTHFKRHVNAEVLASSQDQSIQSHVNLVELTMAHIRCEIECGRDVVVLVDSLTRLVRAFNLHGRGSNRILSGGLDARAVEIPRRFFGLARNIEGGGSVTIIATVHVGTGSRMDEYIFEEFKSTGNSEVVLDRSLAEARIFPAVDLLASGTRKEERLYSAQEMSRLAALHRMLSDLRPKEAMHYMLKLVEMTQNNRELLLKLGSAQVE